MPPPSDGTNLPQLSELSATGSTKNQASKTTDSPCHTCRRQRLRCDATKPSCKKCLTRGVECLGYGAKPIFWVQPKALGQAGKVEDTTTFVESGPNSTMGKKRGRPRLVLMEKNKTEADESSLVPSQPQPQIQQIAKWVIVNNADSRHRKKSLVKKQAVSPGLVPMGYHDDKLALSMLDYMNQYIVSDMVLIDTGANPHRIELEYWRYFPDVIMDMIISCSLTHQVIRCHATQDNFPLTLSGAGNQSVSIAKHRMLSFQNPSIATIYKHQQRTLKQLGQDLNDKELRYGDLILATIITLMRIEIQQSAFGAWPTHLHAARTIIAERGGFKPLLMAADSPMGEALTTYMLMDILCAIFTPCNMLDPHDTIRQLEYIPLLDVCYNNGRDYDFPCSNQLLECIIRINHVRLISQGLTSDSSDLDTTCAQIFHRIASFDPIFWAHSQIQELLASPPLPKLPLEAFSSSPSSSSSSPKTDEERQTAADALSATHAALYKMGEDLAKAFQYAIMLYCIRTLYMDRGKSASQVYTSPLAAALLSQEHIVLDVEQPHQSALNGLLEALHRLWETEKTSGSSWIGKLSLWPLWVAGMEIAPGPSMADEQAFISGSLQRLCYYLGAMSPLDAVSALQVVWARTATQDSSCQQASWDSRLLMPGLRCVFFF